MKLKDLKIGMQLYLGLGVILLLVVSLRVLAWRQTDQLWLQTKNLYDHPLRVRRAVGQMESDVERMSHQVRALFIARNDEQTTASLRRIERDKTDAERQIDILFDRYLGPHGDLTGLREDFIKWNALHDETIAFIRAGKATEAEARLRIGGVQSAQGLVVRSRIRTIDDYAGFMGEQIYRNATELHGAQGRQLGIVVTVTLLLSLGVSWLLLKGIKTPLFELTRVAGLFRQGHLDVRSRYASANEFGVLSLAFNALGGCPRIEEPAAKPSDRSIFPYVFDK